MCGLYDPFNLFHRWVPSMLEANRELIPETTQPMLSLVGVSLFPLEGLLPVIVTGPCYLFRGANYLACHMIKDCTETIAATRKRFTRRLSTCCFFCECLQSLSSLTALSYACVSCSSANVLSLRMRAKREDSLRAGFPIEWTSDRSWTSLLSL